MEHIFPYTNLSDLNTDEAIRWLKEAAIGAEGAAKTANEAAAKADAAANKTNEAVSKADTATINANSATNKANTATANANRASQAAFDKINELTGIIGNSSGAHNGVYRGVYLGETPSAKQLADIQAGTFADMFIGDYWQSGDYKFTIAAFNVGRVENGVNHVTLIVENRNYNVPAGYDTDTNVGYVNSNIAKFLSSKTDELDALFDGHMLVTWTILSNAATDGRVTSIIEYKSKSPILPSLANYAGIATLSKPAPVLPKAQALRMTSSAKQNHFDSTYFSSTYQKFPLFNLQPNWQPITGTLVFTDLYSADNIFQIGWDQKLLLANCQNSFALCPIINIG